PASSILLARALPAIELAIVHERELLSVLGPHPEADTGPRAGALGPAPEHVGDRPPPLVVVERRGRVGPADRLAHLHAHREDHRLPWRHSDARLAPELAHRLLD